jgi:hypothetical protein
VPVITLRRSDYEAVRSRIQPLPGTVFKRGTLPLAPTRGFARALLGSVGPVTAEIVEASNGRLAARDIAGLSGLQAQFDEHLGGPKGYASFGSAQRASRTSCSQWPRPTAPTWPPLRPRVDALDLPSTGVLPMGAEGGARHEHPQPPTAPRPRRPER